MQYLTLYILYPTTVSNLVPHQTLGVPHRHTTHFLVLLSNYLNLYFPLDPVLSAIRTNSILIVNSCLNQTHCCKYWENCCTISTQADGGLLYHIISDTYRCTLKRAHHDYPETYADIPGNILHESMQKSLEMLAGCTTMQPLSAHIQNKEFPI